MPTTVLTPKGDTYISRCQSNRNFSKQGYLVAGLEYRRKNVFRSLIKFDVPEIPAGCEFVGAYLKLYVDELVCACDVSVRVNRIETSFNASTVTWNTAPSMIPTSTMFTVDYRQSKQFVEIDISGLVREALCAHSPFLGIGLTEMRECNGIAIFADTNNKKAKKYEPVVIIHYICPKGPTGPTGPTGPKGPTGPTGATGATGAFTYAQLWIIITGFSKSNRLITSKGRWHKYIYSGFRSTKLTSNGYHVIGSEGRGVTIDLASYCPYRLSYNVWEAR